MQSEVVSLKEAILFSRKNFAYLAETLSVLSSRVEDENYMLMGFLVFKILYSIQRDIGKESLYWERIKVKNTDYQWDNILKD